MHATLKCVVSHYYRKKSTKNITVNVKNVTVHQPTQHYHISG